MTFLIDGYNLMHAIGLARRGLPAGALQSARTRCLAWLAETAEKHAAVIRIVFDAMTAPGSAEESVDRGVLVRFARGRTADDEIEDLLAAATRPASLTVVSNDARLREAARRRGAAFWSCAEFIDWTIAPKHRAASPPPQPAEKPVPEPSEAERAAWLAAFSLPPAKRRRP